jgi:hypothetical protein
VKRKERRKGEGRKKERKDGEECGELWEGKDAEITKISSQLIY